MIVRKNKVNCRIIFILSLHPHHKDEVAVKYNLNVVKMSANIYIYILCLTGNEIWTCVLQRTFLEIIYLNKRAQWTIYIYIYIYIPYSGNNMNRQINLQQFYVLPTHCIYEFCVDLRTNSHYLPIQH